MRHLPTAVMQSRRRTRSPNRRGLLTKPRRREVRRKTARPETAPRKKARPKTTPRKRARRKKPPRESVRPASPTSASSRMRSWAQGCLLQLPLKVIVDHVKELVARIAPGNAVGFVGIDHQLELLARLDQRIDHLHAVLEVNVVVARAVGQH